MFAPSAAIASLIRFNFEAVDSPVYFISSSNAGSSESGGRSSHMSLIKSQSYFMVAFLLDNIFS